MGIAPAIFREYDVRGVADVDLTADAVHDVARAFGTLLRERGGKSAVLGRDCRLSSERLAASARAGLAATGVDVVDVGLVPTPVVYFAAATLPADGLCVITGSHNPPAHNGLKMGIGAAMLHGEQIQDLRRRVEARRWASGHGTTVARDVVEDYRRAVRDRLSLGPRRPKVVVDAGNGTAGVVAVPLFRSLGFEVVPLFVEMDGRFPNHEADPTVEENLSTLRARVREVRADVGIAWDGDGDRVAAVDERGNVLWGDQLLLLFARALLEEQPGAAVVAEAKCSMNLFEDVARRGGRPVMAKAGHSIIRARMQEEGAPLAGEMSGHVFFGGRWFGFDDGVYAAGRLLELLSRTEAPLSTLLADLPPTYASPEVRVACPDDKKFEVVRRAQEWFRARYETITVDGARVVFPDGWGLVRASNTQPLLVLRFEARSAERLAWIEALVTGVVEELEHEVGA